MDIGLSIQMIWSLAAQEAAAGGAAELEPGHFLCAALKLAEMPASVFHDVVSDKDQVAGLEEDQRGLLKILENFGIRVPEVSTPLRRGLRGLLCKKDQGGPEKRGSVIHRSPVTKALFARAETAARECGDKAVGAVCLVQTLLSDPDEVVAGMLARIGIHIDVRPVVGKVEIEWISAFGCDLTAQAREEKSDDAQLETIRRDAVCRVLAEALFAESGVKTLPTLLVSRGDRRAADIVNDLALWLVSTKPPSGACRVCILEIHSAAILNRDAKGSPESRLEDVFQCAATCKSTVLFFDDFHRYLTPSIAGEGLARHFQTLLNGTKTSCVMGMTQNQYQTHIENAALWRNVFRLIWIHDASPNFQL